MLPLPAPSSIFQIKDKIISVYHLICTISQHMRTAEHFQCAVNKLYCCYYGLIKKPLTIIRSKSL